MKFVLPIAFFAITVSAVEIASPVEKVVKLLTDMKSQLATEAKEDQEAYERLACWCENNDKEKTAALEQYEADIRDLEAEVESRAKKGERLTADIESGEKESAELLERIAALEAQRAKQGKENQAQILELTSNIEALKGAIVVLSKHQASAFPQMQLDFLSLRSSLRHPSGELGKLSAWMDTHHYSQLSQRKEKDVEAAVSQYLQTEKPKALGGYSAAELSVLTRARQVLTTFAQYASNVKGTGEIFGILRQLKEQLSADLEELESEEQKQAREAKEMIGSLKVQLKETETMVKEKTAQRAENNFRLADAKENLETTHANVDADTAFLKEVKETCTKSDAQWEERQKTRTQEMAAVSEALSMLTADDARDLFSSTYSFLQVSAPSSRRARAAAVLARAGRRARSSALLALSATVELDAFVKVKAAIKEMIEDLKKQQEDEVTHKDWCNGELQQNEMDTIKTEGEKKDLATKIETLTSTIETLTSEIKTAEADLHNSKVELQRATEDRVQQNKVFQKSIEEQRATVEILNKVLARLEQFYSQALVQAKHRQSPQAPVKFGEYKKNAGAGGVTTMIGNLIQDAKNLEKEATSDEQSAQTAYEQFNADTNASIAALEADIVAKREQKAQAATDLEGANTDHAAREADLASLANYAGDVHKSCDFVLKNFDIRQEARQQEMDALNQATAILSGMQ